MDRFSCCDRKMAMRFLVFSSLLAVTGLLCSCSGGGSSSSTATEDAGNVLALSEAEGEKALSDRFANYQKNLSFDSEGSINKKDSKRSNFEGKQVSNIGGDYGKKQFAANRFSKKTFQGRKEFQANDLQSLKSRWNDQEWFLRKQAQERGSIARADGKEFGTDNFSVGSARERGASNLARPTDLGTQAAQRDYQAPRIFSKEEHEKMSIEESKNELGR